MPFERPADGDLRIAVLGPLLVESRGRDAPVPGTVLRLLLTRLAIADGAPVADSELLVDVWGDPGASASLHASIARLRRLLDPDRPARSADGPLPRVGAGYRLRIAPDGLDADRFVDATRRAEAAAQQDDLETAVATLDEALREWRGPALVDATAARFAQAERARLDELRIAAEQRRLELGVRLGERGIVAALESFTLAHPTLERGWETLARALCLENRGTDALTALRRAREQLAGTSGTDPGPRLAALQRAILHRDPALFARRPGSRTATPGLLPPSRVPAPTTPLVGREPELERLHGLLDRARLVTISGPGGVGKTRLAVEAAGRGAADGPWFADLAELGDPRRLPDVVGRAAGLGGAVDADALVRGLGTREVLLLLDNCEHLVDAVADLVARVLAGSPGVTVLATSRAVLDLPGEHVLPLGPLGPEAAIALFRARAAAASGGDDDEEDDGTTAVLCERLDGLPLAIELAAARTDALSVDDLLQGLDDRFAVLQRRHPGGGRHDAMAATVDWSYRRLTDDERELYEALAVFAGGCTLPAVTAVSGRADAAHLLGRLVAASMVQVTPGRPRRYRLLDTLRDYAARSTDPQRRAALEERHLRWVVALASNAEQALRGRLSTSATEALQDESANIRTALRHAGWRDGLRIGGGFYWYWFREGLTSEGLDALSSALAGAAASAEPVDESARCRSWMGVALLAYLSGDRERIGAALGSAGSAAEASGNPRVQTQYLSTLAYFEAGAGAADAASTHALASLRLAEASSDAAAAAESTMVLGEAARQRGELEDAAALLDDAVAAAERCGYTWAGISSAWIGSKAVLAQGRVADARALAARACVWAADTGETTSWIVGLVTVAHLDLLLGQRERAAVIAGAAAWLGARIGFAPASMDEDLAGWDRALHTAIEEPGLRAAFDSGGHCSAARLRALVTGSPEHTDAAPTAA